MLSLNLIRLNRCDWYILSWVVYYLQGIVYPEGGMISLLIIALNILVSFVYVFKTLLLKNNPIYFKGLNLLLLVFTVYGAYYILSHKAHIVYPLSGFRIATYNYIKGIYLSLLPIYPFYYFSKKGYLTQSSLQHWGMVFLISVTLLYFKTQQEALQALMEKGSKSEEITNNAGYLFLSCIPLLILYRRKPLLQFLGLGYIMMFIVLGMKRGAIGIGCIISIYFILQAISNSKGRIKVTIIILSILICIGAISFFLYQMNNSAYMMQRIQDTMDGNSSGREGLYSFFWTYYSKKASILQLIFGRGANGTLEIYYNYAHNDWLELAVNQGCIGIFSYLIYWFYFYKTWKRSTNVEAKTIISLLLVIYFAQTLFSMSYGDMPYVATCVLGYALANVKKSMIN